MGNLGGMAVWALLAIAPTLVLGQCGDSHIHCAFWASVGECTKNALWMLPNCKRSCRQCDNPVDVTTISPAVVTFGSPALTTKTPQITSGTTPAPDNECPVIQVKEVQTRFVPTDAQFRQQVLSARCAVPNQINICSQNVCYHKKYRSQDGSCNHLNDAMKGAAYTPYVRLLTAHYADGQDSMISKSITSRLITSNVAIGSSRSAIVTTFTQFIMHDITKNTLINTCNCGVNRVECANIQPAPGDRKQSCIPFTRSTPMCQTGSNGRPRLQINENTAFIDASGIYGSDPTTSDQLRTGAFLRTAFTAVRDVIPPDENGHFDTGDDRANLFVGLLAMHSVFLRHHNQWVFSRVVHSSFRLVTRLTQINPHWNPDRLYQEVRKIQAAILQSIVYNELAPALLGGKQALIGPYTGFKSAVDPGVSLEFAGAAARLHGLVEESYPFADVNYQVVGTYTTISASGNPEAIKSRGAALILRGLIASTTRKPGRITTSLTEFLFGGSTDMSSINIQRGRDLGLRPYNDYRKLCGLRPVTSFNDWPDVPDQQVRDRVAQLYRSPEDLDLYVGGLIEEPQQGSLIGPTFSCIYADQLKRLRDGDRHFYKNAGVLTSEQQASIEGFSLARLFCETAEITRVPRDVFAHNPGGVNAVPCEQIRNLDLGPWKE